MKQILGFLKEFYLIFLFFFLITFSFMFLKLDMPFVWFLTYTSLWLLFVIFGCIKKIKNSHKYKDRYYQLYSNTQNELDKTIKLCHQWKDHADEWKRHANELQQKYFKNVDLVVRETKHSAIFPQQQAILSNLTENAVSASTIKSLMDFTRCVDNDTSVFLIRVNHDGASWYFEITGKSIEVDQALYVIDGVRRKIIEFAGNNSLIKISSKICN